jgi:Domain of unknown function (DUF4190)
MSATNPSATPLDRHGSPVRTRGQVPGLAIASFVLGLLGALLFWVPIVGLLLGIMGLVFGLTSRGNAKRGEYASTWQATAGAILGGLAVLASVAFFVVALSS